MKQQNFTHQTAHKSTKGSLQTRKNVRRKRRAFKRMIAFAVLFMIIFSVMESFISMAKESRAEEVTAQISSKYYKTVVIRQGETLWNIAETYCTSDYETLTDYIDVIKELNHLKGDTIYAGERILVVYQE